MSKFYILLDLNDQLYHLMMESSSAKKEIVIDYLLEQERIYLNSMKKDELERCLTDFQKCSSFDSSEKSEKIMSRLGIMLNALSSFYELQEHSYLTYNESIHLGLNPYVHRYMDQYLFYQKFYQLVHRKLKEESQSWVVDYLYSGFYLNTHQLYYEEVQSFTDEDYYKHLGSCSILLEDFARYYQALFQEKKDTYDILQIYLSLLPRSLAPNLYSIVCQNKGNAKKKVSSMMKNYHFEEHKDEEEVELHSFSNQFEYSYEEMQNYQEQLFQIHQVSDMVYRYLRYVYYLKEQGLTKDLEDAYSYLLKYVHMEDKMLEDIVKTHSSDDLADYIEDVLLSNQDQDVITRLNNFSQEGVSASAEENAFLQRIAKKLLKLENQYDLCFDEDMEEDEEEDVFVDPYSNDITELQQKLDVLISYLKHDLTEEEFIGDIDDLEDMKFEEHKDEFDKIMNLNMLHYILDIVHHEEVPAETKKHLYEAICYLIYMEACEREAVEGNFQELKLYHFEEMTELDKQMKNRFSQSRFNLIYPLSETMDSKDENGDSYCRYLKQAYIKAGYSLMSKEDKQEYNRKRTKDPKKSP